MRPGGTLLLMGGTGGRRISRDLGLASAATAVLPPFTAALALELAPVRVNLIAAGFVDTPLSASYFSADGLEARREELRATLPIGRVVGPADVAALAVHLMTNTALTGATYDIDGGQQFVGRRCTRVHMPSLGGATGWVNSEPLEPAELRGHVVLVNFWTLTCINWLRQEPYVRAWSQAYRDDGLIVIGVHTPEFSFEHEIDRVRQATKERAIDYPVAADNDYAIWDAFANRYWPALYFVDTDGIIRDQHFGEGRYEQSERVIQRLLGVERELVSVEGLGAEAQADWDHLQTPETYLGYERGGERRAGRAPPRAPGPQPLGPRRRVDDRAREGRARPGRREHRLPLPRARRASRAVTRSASADRLPRAPRRRASGPRPRRGRRRGRQRPARRRPPVPTRARARRGPRADAADHVPRARRRGVRVHVRIARLAARHGPRVGSREGESITG